MMNDVFSAAVVDLKARGLYRENRTYAPVSATHVVLDGRLCLSLASNNYLGLTHHSAVKKAAMEAALKYGTGSGGARLTTGNHPYYEILEDDLARFKGAEAALVFNTGYMANLGAISAIAGRGDVIFSDAYNHASIIDGCRLSGARREVFSHSDMNDLEDLLKKTPCAGKRLIVVDGVFSMDGDIAPLPELAFLAEKYRALLMVDDAHATGVLGGGRGSAAHFHLEGKADVQMGTLSKALGAEGGYIAGSRALITYLINRARSYIFSTALAPATVAAAHAALRVIQAEPYLTEKLIKNAAFMRAELALNGVETGSHPTPILPIVMRGADRAAQIARKLREQGVIAAAIRPPATPDGGSRLRLTVTAAHKISELKEAARLIARLTREEEED